MKEKYELGGGYAQGYYVTGCKWYLADLWVHPCDRGNGIARELMRQLCEDADKENLFVELECVPDETVISHEDLENFYISCGFYAVHKSGYRSLMMRKPIAIRELLG